MTDSTAFAFEVKATETLEENMLRACETIVSCGLGIRGGQITSGGNNAMAKDAANTLNQNDDLMSRAGGYVRGPFFEMKRMIEAYVRDDLETVALAAIELKKFENESGLYPFSAKPVNYDLNAAGVRLATYREPEGLAKELVDAFDIGYKAPAVASRCQP